MNKQLSNILLLLLFISCTDKENNTTPEILPATVSFSVNTGTMTSKAVEDDEAIHNLYVILFEEIEEEYIYLEYTTATPLPDGSYTAQLYPTEGNAKFYLVANVNVDNIRIPMEPLSDERVKELLVFTFPGQDSPTELLSIPMAGEIETGAKLEAGKTLEMEKITMLRSLAGVTVKNNATNFTLVSMQGYRTTNYMQIIPNTIIQEEDKYKVSEPSIPQREIQPITSKEIAIEEGTDTLAGLYLPESEGVNSEDRQEKATCLIVGGIYQGEGYDGNTTVTYYRIDFGKDNLFGQLLRNHRYNIKITNVSGPGTEHPEDNSYVNIEFEVTIDNWNESEHKIEL